MGIILDKVFENPVEYTTIQLLKISDQSPFEETVSDAKGNLSIVNLALGEYSASIIFMGYDNLLHIQTLPLVYENL